MSIALVVAHEQPAALLDREHHHGGHGDGQGDELSAVEPLPKDQQPQRDGDQRVDEVAEGGVDDMTVVDGIDVDPPVDGDQC